MRSPREQLEYIADELQEVILRLRAEERGEKLYSKDEVDTIVEKRLIRERKRKRP